METQGNNIAMGLLACCTMMKPKQFLIHNPVLLA
jgi:hypothetical protein